MSELAATVSTLSPGATLSGRYRIVRKLGEGGMGEVYEATHLKLGRRVAIKVISAKYADDREAFERFAREAQSAATMGHPGIVDVLDFDVADAVAYFAMELLEGDELGKLPRGKLTAVDVGKVLFEAADAVGAAHERGIVHRDLKPANIFLARAGRRVQVKLLDFGVAKLTEIAGVQNTLTRTGQVVGTPLYMSPEQLQESREVTPSSDVYALGVIGYELLTGRPPFEASSYGALVLKVMTESVAPIREVREGVPDALVSVVERAMSRDPDARYANGHEMASALESFLREQGDTSPLSALLSADSSPESRGSGLADTLPSSPSVAARENGPEGQAASEDSELRASRRIGLPDRRASGSRVRLYLAVATALAVAGGLAVYANAPGANAPTNRSTTAPPEVPADAPDPPSPRNEPAVATPAPGDPMGAGEPGAAPAETGTLSVRTSPPGATVTIGGTGLTCETPCSLDIPTSLESVRLSIRKRGYEVLHQRVLAPFDEPLDVRLTRIVVF